MNSLPFISHHLFVAAIGSEDSRRSTRTTGARPSSVAASQVVTSASKDSEVRSFADIAAAEEPNLGVAGRAPVKSARAIPLEVIAEAKAMAGAAARRLRTMRAVNGI